MSQRRQGAGGPCAICFTDNAMEGLNAQPCSSSQAVASREDLRPGRTEAQIEEIVRNATEFEMEEVVARYMRDTGVSEATARLHERELKRFLTLGVLYEGPMLMQGPVDELWHTFLMFTRQYERFCMHVAGAFLHHESAGESIAVHEDLQASYRFAAAYENMFGTRPDPCVWPSRAVVARCSPTRGGCLVVSLPGEQESLPERPPVH